VTSVLDASGTVAIPYNYYDAAHGWGNVQSATASAATFSGTAVGETAMPTITSGRIVQTVGNPTEGGGLSTGTYIIEAAPNVPRSY
ncbi:MAG TPA: hypothetical protein VNH18_15800, partial [Bryobacteraceae bacterium]|nr:hypothetical protein [Bryobacteraceae bacterium]